jgi:2-oxoisovalerate dehydrogenase E1 component
LTYRFTGHSPSDASSYRTKEEVQAWMEIDPLTTYRNELVQASVASGKNWMPLRMMPGT